MATGMHGERTNAQLTFDMWLEETSAECKRRKEAEKQYNIMCLAELDHVIVKSGSTIS